MDYPSPERLTPISELPDPFLFLDGSRVKTEADWTRRRAELANLIQHYAYGFLPPAEGSVAAEETSSERDDSIGMIKKRMTLRMGPNREIACRLILAMPDGDGSYPAILDGDLGWGEIDPAIAAEVVRRGYVLAAFDRTEIVPDSAGRTTGLYSVYPSGDFGGLAAWAWGYHRVTDYLLQLPNVDPGKIAATGHSRGGKTALLAGALDTRIALTAPNNSGCMGAGCTRFTHEGGETLEIIVRNLGYWFNERLPEFIGKENLLPFDQHSLKALVAPRALLSTEGMDDLWANPAGTQATYQAAKVVYEWLGAGDKIGISFRQGGHGHGLEDWKTLLDFADAQFFGELSARSFDALAYPDESSQAFAWRAPEQR